MERSPKTLSDVRDLLKISKLLESNISTVISEWSNEQSTSSSPSVPGIASPALFQAQREIIAIAGKLTELVQDPSQRILDVTCQFWESRALSILVERRVPDLLEQKGAEGVEVDELAQKTGIEKGKLSRLIRTCCSIHIFAEVGPDVFANNSVSRALVNNEPLRAYVVNQAFFVSAGSEGLPAHLLGPNGHSYAVDRTAWQEHNNTQQNMWQWLETKVPRREVEERSRKHPWFSDVVSKDADSNPEELVERPESKLFGLAMMGGGMISGAAHPHDYPWQSLGEATVVDVGGGIGGFDIQLSRLYPKLKFVVQDRGPNLRHAEHSVWPKQAPKALQEGRVKFMEHDFFQPNPVHDAEVYWLRYIMHDWSDEYCIKILRAIRVSVSTPKSRVLICDQAMNTTFGCEELESAPPPLLPNYGYYSRYSHQRDLCMMSVINGIERKPDEFRDLAAKSGFKIEKIWECRSQVSIVELVIDDIEDTKLNGT